MYSPLTLEEIPKDVPEINRIEWMKMVNSLIARAKPGNYAWRRLENDFGFCPDYTEADVGEPPKGANW